MIFVLTVLTNNIEYTIQCIACFDIHIDSVDKQYIQLNYNVDFNTNSSNYTKILFKALIYFELEQTSN